MDNKCQILIVGACLIIMPGDEPLEVYDDVVNSILLAQLVANKKVEKLPSVNWYETYVSVLDDFWLRQQRSKQTWQTSNPASQSALEFFSAALINEALPETRIINAVLALVAQVSGDDPGIQRLRSFMQRPVAGEAVAPSTSSDVVHLLVAVANSPTSISSAFVEFTTSVELSQNPFQQSYQSGDIQGLVNVHHARATLAEIRFSEAREAIARKVRDKVADNVTLLNLPKELAT